MIIRPQEDTILFITQPDHAVAAAELVVHFEGFAAHPRRDDVHLAVLEHDNGWQELDEDLVFDATLGRALDFIAVPDPLKRSVWPLAIDRLANRSAYAAALVAEHAAFVYSSNRQHPDWLKFFDSLERRRGDLLGRCGMALDTLRGDYRFLAIADLLSLAFCHGWTEDRERFGHKVCCDGGAVTIRPSLLPAAPVPVRVRARRVPDQRYESAAALRDGLARAPAEFLTGVARGASVS